MKSSSVLTTLCYHLDIKIDYMEIKQNLNISKLQVRFPFSITTELLTKEH